MTTKSINDISQVDNSILDFFKELDKEFVPPISQRTTIDNYIKSIFDNDGQLILCLCEKEICGILGLATNHPIWKNYIAQEYLNLAILVLNWGFLMSNTRIVRCILQGLHVEL